MARKVMVGSMVMTGLAFTVGLLVGLCLHLPVVSPPEEHFSSSRGSAAARINSPDQLFRRARGVLAAGAGGPGVARRIQSARNLTSEYQHTGVGGASSSSSPSSSRAARLTIREKLMAIEATYASIAEEKRKAERRDHFILASLKDNERREHQPHSSSLGSSFSSSSSSMSSSSQNRHSGDSLHKQQKDYPSHPSPQAQEDNRRGRINNNRKVDLQKPSSGAGGGGDEGVPESPVLGSPSVSVLVTGGEGRDSTMEKSSLQESQHAPSRNSQGDSGNNNAKRKTHSSSNNDRILYDGAPDKGRLWHSVSLDKDGGGGPGWRTPMPFKNLDDLITGGIYWAEQIESMVPSGFSDNEVEKWRHTVEKLRVVRMEEGCGRMQNRRLTLEDGSQACARYRVNTDQMQGEVFSYYLARLLGIKNLAPVVMTSADPLHDERWASVDVPAARAQWSATKPVVLTPWMERLQPAYIPRELRSPGHRDSTGNMDVAQNLHPSPHLLANRSSSSGLEQLAALVQWSDLIVLDYLTANVDRVVNNLFNLQWNTEMMSSPAHNLEQRPRDGLLVFLDNESGLFHSYRLLDKYAHYHERLLEALCVFRASTAKALRKLKKEKSTGEQLMKLYQTMEPKHWMLPLMPEQNQKVLEERIAKVVDQINRCETRYSSKDPQPFS